MATNWPAYARLWTVATAGQSVASYTTTRDKTLASLDVRRHEHLDDAPALSLSLGLSAFITCIHGLG